MVKSDDKLFSACAVTGLSLFMSIPLMAFIAVTYTALVTVIRLSVCPSVWIFAGFLGKLLTDFSENTGDQLVKFRWQSE